MSQTLADHSEVMFGHQEEIAGAMEMEGSSQNRRGKETWLEATEPYRGARPSMRDFDRPVDGELGATSEINMGQIARLRLIRDRFIAGHENCDLRRYLDCVPPDTPLRDIVDRCRVWESHGTTEIRRVSKPIPEPVYPTYVVEQPDYESEPVCMVSVNKQNSQVELLRKLLEALTPVTPPPVRVPKAIPLDKLTELLMSQVVKSGPAPPITVEPTGLEALLQTYFTGQQSTGLGPRVRQIRRNWPDVKCFSCGKPGHSATRCPTLDVTFPFILPGWKAEKTPTGYLMISPKTAMDRRRAENEN